MLCGIRCEEWNTNVAENQFHLMKLVSPWFKFFHTHILRKEKIVCHHGRTIIFFDHRFNQRYNLNKSRVINVFHFNDVFENENTL